MNSVGPPLVLTLQLILPDKAIMLSVFKLPLIYPGHVLCTQFELGTAAHEHDNHVTLIEPGQRL